jgi:pilus assembly protein Flp/PilA
MNTILSFLRDASGASSIEYAMLASAIAAVIVATVNSLGATVDESYTSVSDALK